MDLTLLELLQGIFSIIWVMIAIIVGLRIIYKAFSLKRNELILVGLCWVLVSSAWWGSCISFLLYIMFGFTLNAFTYFLIDFIFIPVALICWIYSFCHILYPKLKKKLLGVYIPICIIWEIVFIYFLCTNIEIIGTVVGKFNTRHNLFSIAFIVFAILTVLVTGSIFSIKSIQSDDPVIKWKGRFLLIAFISFALGAFIDAALPVTAITIVLARLILISSAIGYYLGFFLPESIAKFLIKNR